MFKNIRVQNFRGIKQSNINGFRRVNLFFGKNNCGKSSLLDAIFLICGQSNPVLPFNINILRDYKKTNKDNLKLDFYNFDTNDNISILAENGEKRELRITTFESTDNKVNLLGEENKISSNIPENKYGLVLYYKLNDKTFHSSIIFDNTEQSNPPLPRTNLDPEYKESLRCRYLNPKYDFYTSVEGLNLIMKNKEEGFIIEALKIIEPQIVDIQISNNDVLVDIGLHERIPINLLGDGTRKMLSIVTTIYECKNGVVLLDEVGNGFHYSVMPNLWRIILSSAKRNNTQVFATTHDLDSIKGLNEAVNKSQSINIDKEEVAAYKLLKTSSGELKSYYYSPDQLNYAIEQEIEMR